MTDFEKQICTEVCFKLDKAARETFSMLKLAIEEAEMSKNQVLHHSSLCSNALLSDTVCCSLFNFRPSEND